MSHFPLFSHQFFMCFTPTTICSSPRNNERANLIVKSPSMLRESSNSGSNNNSRHRRKTSTGSPAITSLPSNSNLTMAVSSGAVGRLRPNKKPSGYAFSQDESGALKQGDLIKKVSSSSIRRSRVR